MALKLFTVNNSNKPEEEYVDIHASADVNAQGYAVIDRTFDSDGVLSNEFRHIYVFHNLEVKKGDWIRLHTKAGKYSSNPNKGKTITYHVFWGSKTCIWNDSGSDTASLVTLKLVNSIKVPKPKS